MTVATLVKTRVPFLDLKAQYASIREEVEEAVSAVLESAHFVGGQWVEKFEEDFARYVGAKYALGVGSGTAALELAFKAAHLGPGDEVIVPANTFFATAEAVTNVGATPVFADVNPATFHLDAATVEPHITPKTRAVVPVHLYGRAVDLSGIERLAEAHDLVVIEDACQAQGARRHGIKVGGSGRLTCFSFYPGKNLGAYGDAGAITCNDEESARTIRMLRDHGSPKKYHHLLVGTNSRLDAIQAAVLSVKLPHLDEWNAMRLAHATTYVRGLADLDLILPQLPPDGEHIFHLFVVRTRKRDVLQDFLKQRGIDTGIHYPVPLHLTPAYRGIGDAHSRPLVVAESFAEEILSLPMYAELSRDQLDYIISALHDFSDHA